MAMDVCSDVFSHRISFSHDLKETDGEDRQDARLLEHFGQDFDFCISDAFIELSSAEELFSDGKIIPGEIKKSRSLNSFPTATVPPPSPPHSEKKKLLKEFLSSSSDTEDSDDPPPPKSFWKFKRSSSLNCDASNRNTSLIRSLYFMSRSNSTGSVPNRKQQKQALPRNLKRYPSVSTRRSTSSSSSGSSFGMPYPYTHCSWQNQAPYKMHYGDGMNINPVLNFQPCISSICNGTLFGLGSLFCNGKARKKKKKK